MFFKYCWSNCHHFFIRKKSRQLNWNVYCHYRLFPKLLIQNVKIILNKISKNSVSLKNLNVICYQCFQIAYSPIIENFRKFEDEKTAHMWNKIFCDYQRQIEFCYHEENLKQHFNTSRFEFYNLQWRNLTLTKFKIWRHTICSKSHMIWTKRQKKRHWANQ